MRAWLTNAERLPRWFAPVSGDMKLGGRYAIQGNASGTVTACTPPTTLDLTWEFGGGVSWVEVRIVDEGPERARLTLCHVSILDEEFWPTYGPGAVGAGWDLGLLGLALHLSGEMKERMKEEDFLPSPEGKELVRAYKTPSLRNVTQRAPFMHAGQIATLSDVIAHYDRAPAAPMGHSELKPLRLSANERRQLEAFLRTLTGPTVAPPGWLESPAPARP